MCWASGRGGIFGYAVRQTRDTVSGPYARPMQPRVDGDAARGLPTRWRVALDVVPGVALGGLAGLAGLTSSEYPNPGPVTAILVCAAGLMLVLRRTQPTVAFVGSMGLMTLVSLVFGSYQAGTAVLIGLVASYSALSWGVPLPVFVGCSPSTRGEAWGEPLPEALEGPCSSSGYSGSRRSRRVPDAAAAGAHCCQHRPTRARPARIGRHGTGGGPGRAGPSRPRAARHPVAQPGRRGAADQRS